ncbi:helix-turn-helix domain-containing protein [Chryseobacterium arthrosphaerae]|uniref:helix-turn-helix domain-containing protein n=1 Tax=Chryseobacterium arthrosphaerae TaxID=651561 RepID=UPI0023E2D86D|nr:helix-turn-helix domain-containing protein [Chryseobacterium arthrosphaerae]WES98182.1 helix-turn-helix domain-containing protein [Chryseobacterium arthrosphaerae]
MNSDIKTLQLQHFEKVHPLRKEIATLSVHDFFEKTGSQKHYRNRFYSLFIFTKGAGSVAIDDTELKIVNNILLFINYNQIYRLHDIAYEEGFVLMFTKTFYNHIYTGNKLIKSDTALNDVVPLIKMKSEFQKDIFKSFNSIKKEYLKNTLYTREILCLQLKELMLRYIRASKSNSEIKASTHHKKDFVDQFCELVNQNFKENKTTASYAKILNLSPNYLNALVRENLGMNAGQFIKNRVILEAERLLLHTSMSVTEISYELGFVDNSHFGKYFKSANGVSPNSYRTSKTI